LGGISHGPVLGPFLRGDSGRSAGCRPWRGDLTAGLESTGWLRQSDSKAPPPGGSRCLRDPWARFAIHVFRCVQVTSGSTSPFRPPWHGSFDPPVPPGKGFLTCQNRPAQVRNPQDFRMVTCVSPAKYGC
jgi:hypothetical protein